MLNEINYTMEGMMASLIAGIPNVIKALLLLLLAWAIAVIAKNIIEKGLVKLGVGRTLGRTPLVKSEEDGNKILVNIARLVYFLVFILFLPTVFGVLNMNEVATPITQMMSKFLYFLPNLVAATIVIVIGVFVAKLIRELTKQFFTTINLDKWFNRVIPENNNEVTQYTISKVLANILYVIVLIPFVTVGLEALKIATISQPIEAVLNNVLLLIPNIFVALILLVAGYYIGKLVKNLLIALLQRTGINRIYSALGLDDETKPATLDLEKFLGNLAQIIIILFFTVEALQIINLYVLNAIGLAIIEYLPNLLSAIIILGIGLLLANLLGNWVKKHTSSSLSAIIIRIVIITFSVFMTLDQLHFATSIVNIAFLLILGGLMIAFAISFGIGGREFAKNQLAKLERKMDKTE